jgi:filamentous hemagglutinin
VKPVSGAVAVGATVIGVGADAVEQLVRPDIGQTGVNSAALIVQTVVEHVPNSGLVAPITNELVEAWKASGSSMKLQEWINQKFGAKK